MVAVLWPFVVGLGMGALAVWLAGGLTATVKSMGRPGAARLGRCPTSLPASSANSSKPNVRPSPKGLLIFSWCE